MTENPKALGQFLLNIDPDQDTPETVARRLAKAIQAHSRRAQQAGPHVKASDFLQEDHHGST